MKEFYCKVINDAELSIAAIALITSVVSIFIGFVGLRIQRKHNKKSVLPIGTINLADYENCLRIKISNNGVGPLIIKSCNTIGKNSVKPYPINWMPGGVVWSTFRENLDNHTILSGSSLTLLELQVNIKNKGEIKQRDKIRTILNDLELEVGYEDIYGKEFKVKRKLDWFGRNLNY